MHDRTISYMCAQHAGVVPLENLSEGLKKAQEEQLAEIIRISQELESFWAFWYPFGSVLSVGWSYTNTPYFSELPLRLLHLSPDRIMLHFWRLQSSSDSSSTPYSKDLQSEILCLLHEASADGRVADRSGRTTLHAPSAYDEADQWLRKACWLKIKIVHSFIASLVHWLIDSFIHLFIHSFI